LLKNHIHPHFGTRRLSQLSPHEVRSWFALLRDRVPGSAPAAYKLLRAILNTAVQDELIPRNPCKVKGAGMDRSAERNVPSLGEVRRLYSAMDDRLKAAIALAAWGTLRKGEVLGLQRGDIDFENSCVNVERALIEPSDGSLSYGPTKNGEKRLVHMPDEVMEILARHLADFVEDGVSAPLFPSSVGNPLRPSAFWRAFDKARSVSGVSDYHFHDLRHFAATEFSATGASSREVMERGGWKSHSMVVRYQHATPTRDRELAEHLPRLAEDEAAS
jgi:integrase